MTGNGFVCPAWASEIWIRSESTIELTDEEGKFAVVDHHHQVTVFIGSRAECVRFLGSDPDQEEFDAVLDELFEVAADIGGAALPLAMIERVRPGLHDDEGHFVTCPKCGETYWSEDGHPAGVPDCPNSPNLDYLEEWAIEAAAAVEHPSFQCPDCGRPITYAVCFGDSKQQYELVKREALKLHQEESCPAQLEGDDYAWEWDAYDDRYKPDPWVTREEELMNAAVDAVIRFNVPRDSVIGL